MIRLFDILFSIIILIITAPIFAGVAIAIKVTSPGPVFYPASRVGKGRVLFRMYKFRSMYIDNQGPEITATNDSRVFPLGKIIRRLKIDELPQFINVVRGEMALVGPRPEAPAIVDEHYQAWMLETLDVTPGITSPGTIFYYATGDALLNNSDPETAYIEHLLAPKLAIDRAYADRETLLANIFVLGHTGVAILGQVLGKPVPPLSRDLMSSKKWYSGSETHT